jgi:hypothetical protein
LIAFISASSNVGLLNFKGSWVCSSVCTNPVAEVEEVDSGLSVTQNIAK